VRPQADYRQSLDVLRFARSTRRRADQVRLHGGAGRDAKTKSTRCCATCAQAGADVATIGQYLQPTRRNLPVVEYVAPAQFERYRDYGLALGFKMVFSGPLVRSSYMADEVSEQARRRPVLNWLLALALGGAAGAGCFPRFDLVWLAPVALTPLLVAVAREAGRGGASCWAGLAGMVYWFGVCYWIQFVLAVTAGWAKPPAGRCSRCSAVAKGLHMGGVRAAGRHPDAPLVGTPAVAALWVAVEVTHGSLGFAWLALGNAGST
jgi:hypothetical protein